MELQELVTLANECKAAGAFTSPSLIRAGGILAAKVNSIQNLSGTEKLKLVQRVLLQVLAEAENKEIVEPNLSKEDIQQIHDRYDQLEKTVAEVLPVSLDLAIKAARGGLDLKKVKPSALVRLCGCFATGVVHQLASLNLISETHATQARRVLSSVEGKAYALAAAKEAEQAKEEVKTSTESPPAEVKKDTETVQATPASKDTA